MNKIKQALTIFRILDADGNVSLTNLALIAAIVNLAVCQEISLTDLGVFMSTVVGYQVKRFVKTTPNSDPEGEDLRTALKELEKKVTAIQVGTALRR